jgi:hypothetical protein
VKGLSVKPDPFGTNSKTPNEAWSGRPEGGSIYAWIEAMKDVFARCSKKMAVQVCKSHNPAFLPV